MSSEIQSVVASLQLNDYIAAVMTTAVGYDYLLTFSREVEYVWKRPWSWVSTLFIVVRIYRSPYCLTAELSPVVGPLYGLFKCNGPIILWQYLRNWAPHEVRVSTPTGGTSNGRMTDKSSKGTMIDVVMEWLFPIFLGVADLLMILRVYAMYRRSKILLAILLAIYIPTTVLCTVATIMYSHPNVTLTVTTTEAAVFNFCVATYDTTSLFGTYTVIPRLVLGVILCTLAVAKFVRESLDMHKAIKQWQPNRYLELLTRESVLYFIAYLVYNVASLIGNIGTAHIVLGVAASLLPYILAPRFILSVREACSHTVWEDVDSGFGVGSQCTSGGSTTMVFASRDIPAGDVEMGERTAERAR
ncbi:hypothetical protein PAXINDRAFT_103107 [Paxillus involutus ATCC 200175]|uniref:DUF6533 domain-containing protein n=1 Tax=Paxillus involutus ATCC 200175 TaxID=664439 RepID=A0A0C9SWD0_PAXIN|nr:hypothetical protein PAXINDRAFT_103107 [Paxillus involutus ATCC 200175]